MHPRILTALFAATAAACAGSSTPSSTPQSQSEPDLIARARGIHQRALTIDTHKDIPFDYATPANDPKTMNSQVNLDKMKAGGYDMAFFAVYVGQGARTDSGNAYAKDRALNKFEAIHRMAEQMYPNLIEIAYTPEDAVRIDKSGKLVAAIGIENGWVIGKDLSLIKRYYDLGARYMTLSHSSNNDICDSSTDARGPEWGGISPFGKQVVAEMNRVGMMVDISHVSKQCMLQATALSTSPVIASHSSTTEVAAVPRNMDDEMLRALAKNGGVAQMVALGAFVKAPVPARDSAVRVLNEEFFGPQPQRGAGGGAPPAAAGGGRGGAAGGAGGGRGGGGGGRANRANLPADKLPDYDRRMAAIEARWPSANLKDFVNHIDHAVKIAGIDHVGISSDFDGGGGLDGWRDASETFNVTLELVRRGYTEEQIKKLWGGNLLRVMGENIKKANSKA